MNITFRFKGDANKPPKEWEDGFHDSLLSQEYWYSRRRTLKGKGHYCNGWAEGNITAHSLWRDYWEESLNGRLN